MANLRSPTTHGAELLGVQRSSARGPSSTFEVPISILSFSLRLFDTIIIYLTALVIYDTYLLPNKYTDWSEYQLAMVLAIALAANLFSIAGIYDERQLALGRTMLLRLLCCWGIIWFTLLTTAAMFKATQDYSRVWFVGWGAGVCVGLMISRLGVWLLVQSWIASGRQAISVALVGAGPIVGDLVDAIGNSERRLHQIVGIFEDDPPLLGDSAELHVSRLADLETLIRRGQIQMVIIALPWTDEDRILRILARLRTFPVDIRLAPTRLRIPFSNARYASLSGITLLEVFSRPISGWKSVAKRVEDLLLGCALVVFFLPLMAIIAAAVKCDSRGPILFRQRRYGYNNSHIEVFKFRTMRHELTDQHAEKLVGPNDARVTRLGTWLRRTSLDELPQLLNVVRGDMSLVGPRPHALRAKAANRLYEDVVDEYASRHRVKPGITGWAQVHGWRGVTDTEDKIRRRIEHDLYYIENWSVMFDLQILAMTIVAVVRPSNAH